MLIREIVQNHWIFFALGTGLLIVLIFALSYAAMWKPREIEEEQARVEIKSFKNFYLWLQSTLPWVLILTILGVLILYIAYPILRSLNPPNW